MELKCTGGQELRRSVKVICWHLDSLTLMRQLLHQCSIKVRWFWRFKDAMLGSESDDRIAVSSAKVARKVSGWTGISAVKRM